MAHGKVYGDGKYFAVFQYPDNEIYISDMGYSSAEEAMSEDKKQEGPKGDKVIGALFLDIPREDVNQHLLGHFYVFNSR